MVQQQRWRVSDALWERVVEVIPPPPPRRRRYPGRKRADDRACLEGILVVLWQGIGWAELPREPGRPAGKTCWKRFDAWTKAGVWQRLHQVLIDELAREGRLDLRRALVDSSVVLAKKGAMCSEKAPLTGAGRASNATS